MIIVIPASSPLCKHHDSSNRSQSQPAIVTGCYRCMGPMCMRPCACTSIRYPACALLCLMRMVPLQPTAWPMLHPAAADQPQHCCMDLFWHKHMYLCISVHACGASNFHE